MHVQIIAYLISIDNGTFAFRLGLCVASMSSTLLIDYFSFRNIYGPVYKNAICGILEF